ncbi:MAG: site-2 protease family protein [Phycisphaerae bacterium]
MFDFVPEIAVVALSQPGPQMLVGLLVLAPLIALSLSVHEFWHAYSAELLGDPTGKQQGRCTLNPLVHLDPLGTLMLFIGPVGWARPVPVNPLNFRNPSRDMMISVAAGPASNIGLALLAGILLRVMTAIGADSQISELSEDGAIGFVHWAYAALGLFLMMNVYLALFNLIPLFPLDGHHLLREMLKGDAKRKFAETQQYGIFILAALLFSEYFFGFSILGRILYDPALRIMELLAGAQGLHDGQTAYQSLGRFFLWG